MAKVREVIEEVLRNRILFIGEKPPNIERECLQIYNGCPNDLINELEAALASHAPDSGAKGCCPDCGYPEWNGQPRTRPSWCHHKWHDSGAIHPQCTGTEFKR